MTHNFIKDELLGWLDTLSTLYTNSCYGQAVDVVRDIKQYLHNNEPKWSSEAPVTPIETETEAWLRKNGSACYGLGRDRSKDPVSDGGWVPYKGTIPSNANCEYRGDAYGIKEYRIITPDGNMDGAREIGQKPLFYGNNSIPDNKLTARGDKETNSPNGSKDERGKFGQWLDAHKPKIDAWVKQLDAEKKTNSPKIEPILGGKAWDELSKHEQIGLLHNSMRQIISHINTKGA